VRQHPEPRGYNHASTIGRLGKPTADPPPPQPGRGKRRTQSTVESIRCGTCRARLFDGAFSGRISIKCGRCKTINNIERADPSPSLERPGASVSESARGPTAR
jgi:phage FluMu protein Com